MRKHSRVILLSVLTLVIASCHIDESVGHCIQKTKVLLNWVETHPIAEAGKPVTIVIPPSEYYPDGETFNSDIHGPEAELNVGQHTVVAYETAENTHIDANSQTVKIDAAEDGTVTNPPDYFSAGSTVVEITPASDANITLPLYKQVRELDIQLKFEGLGSAYVDEVAGNLDGIAIERHINHGFRPVDHTITRPPAIKKGNIDYAFGRIAGQREVLFSGDRNLLGIDGNGKQTLKLIITFKDDKTYTISEDITTLMDGFHTEELDHDGDDKPWYIKLTFAVDAEFNISIIDWEDGGESWIVAE